MKYAIVANGGKQYKVTEGQVLEIDRIEAEPGSEYVMDTVLLAADGDAIEVGAPYVDGYSVTTEVVEQTKGDKIRVAKFKAKAKYRKVTGFRASLTKIKVNAIGTGKKKASK